MNIEEKLLAYETPSLQELFICANVVAGDTFADAENSIIGPINDGDEEPHF